MGAYGFFGQPAEEREAVIDRLEEDARDRELLTSAFDKISTTYEGLAPRYRIGDTRPAVLRLTTGELRVLRQFGRKCHDD